jgi:hypothetical protein
VCGMYKNCALVKPLRSIFAVGFSGGCFLHMASYPEVGRESDQRHRDGAQGQDQEQPDHPHDALGYQKEIERAPRCGREMWARASRSCLVSSNASAGPSLACHGAFDLVGRVRQVRGQVDQLAVLVHVESVFNPHAQFFLRDVDARFERKHRPRT